MKRFLTIVGILLLAPPDRTALHDIAKAEVYSTTALSEGGSQITEDLQ